MKWILSILVFFLAFQAMAQRPLNKRDQKAKEEFEAMIAAEEKYNKLLENADNAFKAKEYVLARMTYDEAIQYNPEMEQWLVSKVNDLDILMAKNAARAVDSIYVSAPTKAAQQMEVKANRSIETRQTVTPELTVVSAEEETDSAVVVKEPIHKTPPAVTKKTPEPKEVKTAEKQPTVVSEKAKDEKVKEDFSQLNDGITEETFTLDNHEVLRIVVKEGIDIKVFKRVKHNWGGEFYFLDAMDVSKRYWMEQVDLYRVKYAN